MITTTLQGRLGNQAYSIMTLLAHAKKHSLQYYIPDKAYHCDGSKVYFPHMSSGPEMYGLQEYHEQVTHAISKGDGTYHYNIPAYHDIPGTDNIKLVGYWQSFKYFDWCKDYILEKFQLPYSFGDKYIGIHIRRGDFLQLQDKHPSIPLAYYITAINLFRERGYKEFVVFSDDIEWCMETFSKISKSDEGWGYPNGGLDKSNAELNDLTLLSSCAHQILCYSTFGFVAAWLNQNPDKIVLIPPRRFIFGGANADMIPDYFTELEFE